ncbi:MAG: LysR family substrate-binding domain-containing protein [Nostoc sp. TH1S01]|nr:LysR family substrate-binding domain-containing protein [Nostoc sp. TH1S01]
MGETPKTTLFALYCSTVRRGISCSLNKAQLMSDGIPGVAEKPTLYCLQSVWEYVTWETIFQESLVVALPETHILAKQSQISLISLANEGFILFPRKLAPGLYDLIISLCQQSGFSPNVVQEAIQMQTIVSIVAAEMGVAIVPASLQNLQRTGVVYKYIEEPTPKVTIAMIWRSSDASSTVQKFVDIVRQSSRR